jgi:hypothetical protein
MQLALHPGIQFQIGLAKKVSLVLSNNRDLPADFRTN